MKTKWGNAKIDKRGYYVITSYKEGNNMKSLHRLIWEDFYNTEVPKGYVIHHRNHIKTDNCILNLQLMKKGEHHKLHNSGEGNPNYDKHRHHSEKTKGKISKSLSGENNPLYRMDLPSGEELLNEYFSSNVTYGDLAKKYNCAPSTIGRRIRKSIK